jgi:hypothetical protein
MAWLCQGLNFNGKDGGKIVGDRCPGISCVGRAVHLATRCAEVDAAVIEGIDCHRVAEDIYIAVLLRKTLGEWLPFMATDLAAVDLELTVERKVFGV